MARGKSKRSGTRHPERRISEFKPQAELRRNIPIVVEAPKVCVVPLLEFKPQVQSRMPVIKPTAPTAPMPKFDIPPACPPKTTTQP